MGQSSASSTILHWQIQKQERLVSAKAERPNYPSPGGVSQPVGGGGSSTTMPRTWLHKADSTYSGARPEENKNTVGTHQLS